ncbi:PIG-L domain-containing protein [Cereibacter changlensis JA139]|uniref:PIG-L domain-containing protein n=2 Tax=Cereibacter changlensis TaxID=402884 RepID=A0A2T4JTJ5_9RHOB|nr:PIG-L family deacetylase [Cereibacter changlensis]PTE21241.1 PIG-L domain-containing protein [Cereibacter changlensis JA139]PZX56204.1 LmbE family N-acetylglucosaminyl deacetylase [Cereibacter changlensis]
MNDHARLAAREASPALMRLHRALSRLGSVVTVMNTGAHPDDEQNGMLAWFRLGLGMRVIVACSTRGEGGQNILGPERGGLLGVLRSREMEESARVIDADVIWLGHGPADPVHDFGFSKDGDATFLRWGEERTLERLVRAYRSARPDIVIPTFLDVPGQHGHHRAMTRAAETALALAADPAAFPDHAAEGLAPWRVAKFYLPAWSGGGATYDDALPPPPATLTVRMPGREPFTGAPYAEIGEWSRKRHASQGMGRWRDAPASEIALHLLGGAAEETILDALPATLAALAAMEGAQAPLTAAAAAIDTATAAFPDRAAILVALADADRLLEAAEAASDPAFRAAHGHRLSRKRREVQAAMAEAAGLGLMARATPAELAPGQSGEIRVILPEPFTPTFPLRLVPHLPEGVTAEPVEAQAPGALTLPVTAAADAPFSPQFFADWQPTGGNGQSWLELFTTLAGRAIRWSVDLEEPLRILPAASVEPRPDAFLLPLDRVAPLQATLSDPEGAVGFTPPEGWQLTRDGAKLTLTPPAAPAPGLTRIPATLSGRPAARIRRASLPHVGGIAFREPAELRVLALDLKLPEGARVAYVGSGDSVGLWLHRMGVDVTILDRIEPGMEFQGFTTVLIGVVAVARPDLAAAVPALHRFVEAGGHLVTLYQRPDQGWLPGVSPRPLTVGTPSLRWRVTDPEAPVTLLEPDHPLLAGPNRIGPADFAGWNKERGIYFAADWDAAYLPLLSMADPGEAQLTGALVSGRIGGGRHSHVALVLHHQLDALVPGAFRLMANLVQPAG